MLVVRMTWGYAKRLIVVMESGRMISTIRNIRGSAEPGVDVSLKTAKDIYNALRSGDFTISKRDDPRMVTLEVEASKTTLNLSPQEAI